MREPANVVDGLFYVGRAINKLAEVIEMGDRYATATAIDKLADAVAGRKPEE